MRKSSGPHDLHVKSHRNQLPQRATPFKHPTTADYIREFTNWAKPAVGVGPVQSRVSMRFTLVDLVTELEPGARITTIKTVTLAEEYLDDHFPRFPVLPGVLMLEAMTQACAWLIRVTDDFAHSIVTLKEARNVKYGRFVKPGQTLMIK